MKKQLLIAILLVAYAAGAKAQSVTQPIELHGVVISNDSLRQFLPNVQILVRSRGQMTTTDHDGFFSLVAMPGDTVLFQHIGFQLEKFWVPDTLHQDQYLSKITLRWDTELLDPVIVYPWPSRENFKEEFLAMEIETTELDIANRNLAIEELKERARAMGYDASEMADHMIKLQNQQLYNQGRYYGADGASAILGALTNPFAWTQLFNSLKR